jgi:superfamily II DNA or RNA helicase
VKAVINERFWIKATDSIRSKVQDLYQFKTYDEKQCDRCELRPERHCDVCSDCPAYLGETKLWKTKDTATDTWIGVPKGNRVKIHKLCGDQKKTKIVDKRSTCRMAHRIKFTGVLREHQIKPIDDIIAKGYGVLLAPPRSGKTVMACAIACRMRFKTLILAAQQEWLDEFYRTFMGNETIPAMTNAPDIAQFESTPIVGFCKTVADFERHDVCLATYQSFISKGGKERLKQVSSMFGLVIVDEVQGTASTEFARVMLGLNARHVIGLTGTNDRKDGKYQPITLDIIGPVTARAVVETMTPTVKLVESPASTTYNYKLWTYAMRYLATHKERNALIVKYAVHYIKLGHSIVIPVMTVAHSRLLSDAINLAYGKNISVSFTSQGLTKTRRAEILDGARSYKIKCVVGIRSLVQTGINVPRWSCLIEAMPISNVPKFTQETSRIRTTMKDKPEPVILHIIERFGPSSGCLRTCYWQTYVKDGFKMSDKTRKQILGYIPNKRQQKSMSTNLSASFDLV